MTTKEGFKAQTSSVSAAAEQLESWGISFERLKNGTLLVRGDMDISGKWLTNPHVDLSCVLVNGIFKCTDNFLTSLEWIPRKFAIMYSDFGTFRSWEEAQEKCPATIKKISKKPAPKQHGHHL